MQRLVVISSFVFSFRKKGEKSSFYAARRTVSWLDLEAVPIVGSRGAYGCCRIFIYSHLFVFSRHVSDTSTASTENRSSFSSTGLSLQRLVGSVIKFPVIADESGVLAPPPSLNQATAYHSALPAQVDAVPGKTFFSLASFHCFET